MKTGTKGMWFAVAAILSVAVPSYAVTPLEGGDPRVLNAMQAAAQSRVVASKAVDDQNYTQPDSVLAMSCFSRTASSIAQQAGNVFSGDFREQLGSVVDDTVKAHTSNFKKNTLGGSSGSVDYTSNTAIRINKSATPVLSACVEQGLLVVKNSYQGLRTGTPPMTQSQLLDPTYASTDGKSVYNAALNNANATATRNAAQNAVAIMPDLPANLLPPCRGASYNTPCKVMVCRGVLPASTTCP
jgi:hypothetical protein